MWLSKRQSEFYFKGQTTYLPVFLESLLIGARHFQKAAFFLGKIYKVTSWNVSVPRDSGIMKVQSWQTANESYPSRFIFMLWGVTGAHSPTDGWLYILFSQVRRAEKPTCSLRGVSEAHFWGQLLCNTNSALPWGSSAHFWIRFQGLTITWPEFCRNEPLGARLQHHGVASLDLYIGQGADMPLGNPLQKNRGLLFPLGDLGRRGVAIRLGRLLNPQNEIVKSKQEARTQGEVREENWDEPSLLCQNKLSHLLLFFLNMS